MITICVIELCGYGKQIAPVFIMTITAVTTVSILLCKTKKSNSGTQSGTPNKESTIRVSFRDQQVSGISEPILPCSLVSQINTIPGPSDPLDLTQGETCIFEKKDEGTPLFSDPTEEDTEAKAGQDKSKSEEKKKRKGSSKKGSASYRIDVTQQSGRSVQKKAEIKTASEQKKAPDLPVDSSQPSSLMLDPTMDDPPEREYEPTPSETMREIPLRKLLDLKKKALLKLQRTQSQDASITQPSERSHTGDEGTQACSDETDDSE